MNNYDKNYYVVGEAYSNVTNEIRIFNIVDNIVMFHVLTQFDVHAIPSSCNIKKLINLGYKKILLKDQQRVKLHKLNQSVDVNDTRATRAIKARRTITIPHILHE